MKYIFFIAVTFIISTALAQKKGSFSGELVYNIEKLSPKDSSQAKMLIFAKDSLLKVINFSSILGKQEMIKHLRLNRSYILVTTTKGDFAIKNDHNLDSDSIQSYSFRKVCGRKKIATIRAKKALVTFKGIDKKFIFYYTPKINAKYSGSFENFPGLLIEYFVANENGLFRYTLESIRVIDPPLEIFSIPSNYKKVTINEFIDQVSAQ